MKDVVVSSFALGKNQLIAVGTPTFEQWLAVGVFIKQAQGAVHFWIGDWVNYGEKVYGESYAQALDHSSYEYQTIANDKWVAGRIHPIRRRESLTFDHHATVAEMEEEDQEILLKEAVDKKLSTKAFRSLVRNYKMKLELPELPKKEYNVEEEFEKVERTVEANCVLLEALGDLDIAGLIPNARDFLFSQLKKTVGIIGQVLLKYEK
jgi:hypothetical protein